MAKLKFTPNPTFELPLSVPVAGQLENEEITFTVKHLTETDYNALLVEGMTYQTLAREIATGWDLDVAFNPDNLDLLLDNYPHLGVLLFQAYQAERYKAAEKN